MMGAVPGPLDEHPEAFDGVGMDAPIQWIDIDIPPKKWTRSSGKSG